MTDQLQHRQVTIIASQITKAVSIGTLFSVAPYLCGFLNLFHYYRKRLCQCSASGQLVILLVTNFVPRLIIMIIGLGTRLLVRMRTKLQNCVLRNGQQPQNVINGFY